MFQKSDSARLLFLLSATVLITGCFGTPPMKAHTKDELSERARALLDEADQDMFLYRFDEALAKADEVLAIHPDSREALNMVYKARLAQLDNQSYRIQREKDVSKARATRDALRAGVIPEEQPALERSSIAMAPGLTEKEQSAIQEKLEKKVEFLDLIEADLDEVLYKIFKDVDLNIALDPGNFQGKKFTVRGKNMTVRYLLENISRTQGLNFTVDDENVWIVSSDKPVFIQRTYRLKNGVSRFNTRGGYEGLGTIGFLGQTTQTGQGGGFGQGAGGGGGQAGGLGGQSGQLLEQEKSHLEKFIEKVPTLVPDWPEGSEIYIDKQTNSVLIKSTREAIQAVEKMLEHIDEAPKQVSIEARFVQIEGEENFDFGFSWDFVAFNAPDATVPDFIAENVDPVAAADGFVVDPGNVSANDLSKFVGTTTNFPNNFDPETTQALGTSQLAFKGVFRDHPFEALLTAIQRTTFSNMVSAPSITVTNNNTAVIGITRNLPFIEDFEVENSTTGAVPTNGGTVVNTTPVATATINDENFEGRALVVTPSIGADAKTVSLYVQPVVRTSVSSITIQNAVISPGLINIPAIVRPILETKYITTQVNVSDGDTVVIGGLITDEVFQQEQKVPFLGDIPFIGNLFKRTSNVSSKVNLYIFITVRIVSPSGQYYE